MRNNRIDHTLFVGLLLAVGAQSAIAAPATHCNSITGGGAKVTSKIDSGCVDCTIETAEAAADGKADSFASLTLFSLQGASLRATAQPGIVFPAGGRAGVFYSLPNNNPDGDNIDSGGTWSFAVHTYLGGKLQESDGGLANSQDTADGSHASRYSFVETTKPYDAVEVYFSDAQLRVSGQGQPTVGSAAHKVYEICSDGGISE